MIQGPGLTRDREEDGDASGSCHCLQGADMGEIRERDPGASAKVRLDGNLDCRRSVGYGQDMSAALLLQSLREELKARAEIRQLPRLLGSDEIALDIKEGRKEGSNEWDHFRVSRLLNRSSSLSISRVCHSVLSIIFAILSLSPSMEFFICESICTAYMQILPRAPLISQSTRLFQLICITRVYSS